MAGLKGIQSGPPPPYKNKMCVFFLRRGGCQNYDCVPESTEDVEHGGVDVAAVGDLHSLPLARPKIINFMPPLL